MKKTRKKICILQEAESKKQTTETGAETILAILLLAGILFSLQDIGYSMSCPEIGLVVGIAVILLRQITETKEKLSGKIRGGLYILGIGCFVLTIRWLTQGFLFTVSNVIYLWNQRFGTETELFSTTEAAGTGAVILWGLAALCLASFILTQLKKRKTGTLLLSGLVAFAFSTILGQSEAWGNVFLLLPAVLGIFMLYSSPGQRIGARGGLILVVSVLLIGGICLSVNSYQKLSGIEKWKNRVSRVAEKIRYGEDSLPQGNLRLASELLDGEENRLEVTFDSPQELYLRGYVGADYQGTYWKTASAADYQGDYEGMLKWLEKSEFDPVIQYGKYMQLTGQNTGNSFAQEEVQIKNTGAYRKYLYLPTSAFNWSSGEGRVQKDWQVLSHSLLGSYIYKFDMAEGAATAEAVYPASWLENPSGEKENQYLDAEAVYHSFAENNYMEVSEELKPVLQQLFFADEEKTDEMDFTELTKQIRKVLRTETDYIDSPENPAAGEDTVKWFLTDYKKGNAVYYASAAVMAYRLAGYPARYVEGYHLSAEDVQTMEENGQTTAELTTGNAHVWAEVYVAGVGWLPVETVPGMYLETYSNQLMEGKAAYQINVSPGQDGISTDLSGSEGVGSGEGQSEKTAKLSLHDVSGVLVLILYIIFGLYLLLEFQRAVRIALKKKRKRQKLAVGEGVSYYVEEVERLMNIGKIKFSREQTKENWDLIQEKIPGVTREELKRAVELVQKERFGGIKLKPYEYRTLESLAQRLESKLYQNGTWYRKALYRYVWVLRK